LLWDTRLISKRRPLLDAYRYQNASTIIASQIPATDWYKLISNPTVAYALLDRLLHNSHRIELAGESMRKLDQSDQLG
ncbi:ATP-binding protein, partial [uncultured Paraglaciecola sp.]|uniref:ATP-binding protein n=1 Tax=uncultured Paraglaciecola sp. TaxID=1765024 RepID=UPI0030D96426